MGLLAAISDFLNPPPAPSRETQAALDRIGELVDPFLATTSGFDHHLAGPVLHALGYCEGLVAALPGPIAIDRRSFAHDPLVHALFATASDIEHMLGRSQAVRDYLSEPESYANDHFYALFAARRQEKKQLGVARQGDVVRNEVPQTVLFFSSQTLVEPHPDLESTLVALRRSAFDSLLKSFHTHIDALRQERDAMRNDCSTERTHLTVMRGRTPGPEFEIRTRRLVELEARLHQVVDALAPDQLSHALADFLLMPQVSLSLSPVSVTVDRLGIIADSADGDQSGLDTLHFPELSGRDQRRHLVMLARIDREEAQQAVDAVLDQQRRFLVI